MRLSELQVGTSLQLAVSFENQHFEFETKIDLIHKSKVMLEPVRKDNKLLNVHGKNVQTDLLLIRENEKPILWKNVDIVTTKYKHGLYYMVDGEINGKEYNRRGAYRMFVGETLDAKIGIKANSSIQVILKDISNSGFAIINNEEIDGGDDAFIFLSYQAKMGDVVRNLPLMGKVVRKMTLQDGRILYGCALVKKNDMIGHYINQKQMEDLQKKRQSYADKQRDKKENESG